MSSQRHKKPPYTKTGSCIFGSTQIPSLLPWGTWGSLYDAPLQTKYKWPGGTLQAVGGLQSGGDSSHSLYLKMIAELR